MKKLILILFSFILIFAGCKKGEPPVVDFTFTGDNCTASCPVSFTNTTIVGNTFHWDFGDGQSSEEGNPAPHTYTQGNTYQVTLTSTNDKGTSSKTHDIVIQAAVNPCQWVSCLNGGYCSSGTCICPTGYTGSNCGTEMTPSSMTITKIILHSYPMYDNGSYWDPAYGNPDIYLNINYGTTTDDIQTTGIASNHTGGAITYTNGFPFTISSPSSNWTICAWDYDTADPDDQMGGFYFIPNDHHSGFPSTINLNGGGINVTLYVTWNF